VARRSTGDEPLVAGEAGCCLAGPGSERAKSGDDGWAVPMTWTSRSTGSSSGMSLGKVFESAALSETYHSPGAGNLSLS
jgi:hypothetical protein